MTIDDTSEVDIVTFDKEGRCILVIVDHEEWKNKEKHLQKLQDKINLYLSFIESGELSEKFSEAQGRDVLIEIVAFFQVPKDARWFMVKMAEILAQEGIGFQHRQHHFRSWIDKLTFRLRHAVARVTNRF